MIRRTVLILASVLLLAPFAGAETSRSYGFTGDANANPTGTFELRESGADLPNVEGLQTGKVWADPNALELGANIGSQRFVATLYFESIVQSPGGGAQNTTVSYGYWDGTGFHSLASQEREILRDGRGTSPEAPVPPAVGVTKTPADIGNATFDFVVTGVIPEGAFIAIKVQTTGQNTLYTAPSFLTTSRSSTATVPLPELPALVLFSVGALAVLGVVYVRRK